VSINFWKHNCIPELIAKKNLVTNWSGTDNENNFKNNHNKKFDKDSIIYQYNSYGFRCQEFDLTCTKPSVLCIGCSFTEGIGISANKTWVYHIEKNFPEYAVYNLGVGGGSADTVSRILYNIGNLLNTKIVFVLWPSLFRYELYNKCYVNFIVPEMGSDFYASRALTDEHATNLKEKNRAIVNLLSSLYNYRVIELNSNAVAISDYGRDRHPGPIWHQNIAKMFLEKYHVQSQV
jgi:hypothetical protein